MAEGLFLKLVDAAGLGEAIVVDSAGTSGHHEGEMADRRMRATAASHGVALTTHSRPLVGGDFHAFDYILTMDRSVHRDVLQSQANRGPGKARVMLIRDFDPVVGVADVPDPYYGGPDGFEEVYQILLANTTNLLAHLRQAHGI